MSGRREAKDRYKRLLNGVAMILFRHDPMGIAFGDNTDEYDLEAGTIVPHLRECRSESDVLRVVLEEFVRWFDRDLVEPGERYDAAVKEIWELYRELMPG